MSKEEFMNMLKEANTPYFDKLEYCGNLRASCIVPDRYSGASINYMYDERVNGIRGERLDDSPEQAGGFNEVCLYWNHNWLNLSNIADQFRYFVKDDKLYIAEVCDDFNHISYYLSEVTKEERKDIVSFNIPPDLVDGFAENEEFLEEYSRKQLEDL